MAVPGRKVTLSAATTGTGTSCDCGNWDYVSINMIGTGTISGGAVIIEESDTSVYTGTWSTITTLAPADVTGGATKTVKLPAAQYSWLRGRVTSTVTGGGSITIAFKGQQ